MKYFFVKINFFIILISFSCCLWANSFNYKKNIEIRTSDLKSILHLNWGQVEEKKERNIENLLSLLKMSKTGRDLVQKVELALGQNDQTWNDLVKEGEVSHTDTSLIRYFKSSKDRIDGEISYKKVSVIHLANNLSVEQATIELGHEMVHYLKRKTINPYDKNFNLENYLKDVIEGEGGEVDAFFIECQLAQEIFSPDLSSYSHCRNVAIDIDGRFQLVKELFKRELYKVGNYFSHFWQQIEQQGIAKDHFPLISKKNPALISAVHSLPYPLAIIKDYQELKKRVDANEVKRRRVAIE